MVGIVNRDSAVEKAWREMIEIKSLNNPDFVESAEVERFNASVLLKGPAVHKQMLGAFATAFVNYRHQNIRYVEGGEWIIVEGVFTGTHARDIIMGKSIIVATYRKINFSYSGVIKVANGKVVESRLSCDSKLFLNQLGLD